MNHGVLLLLHFVRFIIQKFVGEKWTLLQSFIVLYNRIEKGIELFFVQIWFF